MEKNWEKCTLPGLVHLGNFTNEDEPRKRPNWDFVGEKLGTLAAACGISLFWRAGKAFGLPANVWAGVSFGLINHSLK